MKKIVLAYSGGLDTSYCLKKLSIDNEVHAVNINTGGYTIEESNKIKVLSSASLFADVMKNVHNNKSINPFFIK